MNARSFHHVPRTALYLVCGSLVVLLGLPKLYSQELPRRRSSWIPRSLTIESSGAGKWAFGREIGIGEMRLRSVLGFGWNLNLVAVATSRVGTDAKWNDWDKRENGLTELFFRYSKKFPILPYGLQVRAKAGKVEWYPIFTDPELIIENFDLYLHPKSIYGVNLTTDVPLTSRGYLNAHVDFSSGDLSSAKPIPTFKNAFLRFTPGLFIKDLGLSAQVGRTEGTRHIVSEAFVHYSPTILGDLKLDFRVGKLPGKDQTPYGARISLERPFKYIALGGYYERRLNQPAGRQIMGFSWRIISPPWLARFMSTFMVSYDTNTNTLWANIPLIAASIGW
ncbi:MAG: hypothetical protein NTX53_03015 [candidate division WOR-3 bacterium]|nr:hypothetical protein [candidate division WOR-3 bacterium]